MALTYWQLGDRKVVVSYKPDAITVSLTDEELVSYDHAGRFLSSYDHGTNVRRGLDNSFQKRWREKESGVDRLYHRFLTTSEARSHVEEVRIQVGQLLEATSIAESHPATAAVLRRASEQTHEHLVKSARVFTRLYGHIPILPPDQYRALVIQATDGCTYNRCTFCTLYRDKTFRTRTPDEFRRHIYQVLDFMSEGLSYRTSVFLGDANAIALATPKLLRLMEILHGVASLEQIIKRGGIHAFLDIYTGSHKSRNDYMALGDLGLRRVSLGIESGSEKLLAFVQKPGKCEDIIDVVRVLKEAAIAVVAIFMVGLGGHESRVQHLEESASLVRKLPLTRGDIIYLSQFSPGASAPYVVHAERANIRPLDLDEMIEETLQWKTVLSGIVRGTNVKVAPYHFQRFIY